MKNISPNATAVGVNGDGDALACARWGLYRALPVEKD